MGGDKLKMVLLTASNYDIWKIKMMDHFYVEQLAKPIETEGVKPNDFVQDWTELDMMCFGYIRDYIDVGVIYHVENETTLVGCWNKLEGLYERKTTTHKASLVRQLRKLRGLFHAKPHKAFFNKYKEGDFGEARMGNNGVSKIMAIGDFRIKSSEGHIIVLKEV
ncbi:hypothetical protein LIER_32743 [Lithospermum erythrorhizon]|uniref:Uncharacterized protein n=1 Tax=Lithospermum erythrorhizon TaxID=34254 RepID=A0AAV3RX78_LITER